MAYLGAPLATIAVVAKELLRDAKPSDKHYEDLVLLRQAERCRADLADIRQHGRATPPRLHRLGNSPNSH